MRKLVTIIFVALCSLPCISSKAQTFAPLGAEWYYDMAAKEDGVFHFYVSGDTVIDNIPCRAIVQKAIMSPYYAKLGLKVNDLPTLYVYNNPDTVFVYNTLVGHFTPLYVFNVAEGDTVHLPIMQSPPSFIVASYPDKTFSFVVDSIRIVQYDTAHLKTVYTHPLDSTSSTNYVYGYGPRFYNTNVTGGAYIMSIGQISGGLLPTCMSGCGAVLSESSQGCSAIRCYNDSMQALKLVTADCIPFTESVITIAGSLKIFVYPNPTTGKIYITTDGISNHIVSVGVCDILGNNVPVKVNPSFSEIGVDRLANGIYYLTIRFDNQPSTTQKIWIQNK